MRCCAGGGGVALRDRPAGGGLKPPQAAAVKSRGGERCGKGARDASGVGREGEREHEKFTFLGYEFRPRLAKNRHGKHFVSFLPAVSPEAMKAMGREIRSWHWAKRSDKSLGDLALMFNSVVQGWINYYGRFYRSRLLYFLRRLNDHLVRWACRKYDKRLRNRERRAMELLAGAARRSPRLFAHWRLGACPDGWAMGAG